MDSSSTLVSSLPQHLSKIAQVLGIRLTQVEATAKLLAEGGTIPFIARYRKEVTGMLDEVAISQIKDLLKQLQELDTRRKSILESLSERKLLTPELEAALLEAETLQKLEDVYQPFRPKKRTRASIAKEKGLEPLADYLWTEQDKPYQDFASTFINPEKEVNSLEDALSGARDILAERMSDDAAARQGLRQIFQNEGVLHAEVIPGKEQEGAKFKDYFAWNEPLKSILSHRLLAIRRGEQEGFLFMRIRIPEGSALSLLEGLFIKKAGPGAEAVRLALKDAYKRLLVPSLETEARMTSKEKADKEAIRVFADNLRELLLASPLGQKRMLAIDPGFRTGCKVVCLDAQGGLVHTDLIFIQSSPRQEQEAKLKLLGLCERFKIEAIAIGNGTASRETESFVKNIGLPKTIPILMVNESGASIYSASEVAREEFPNEDITVRGAVSIGRRLMDPLAELVKIDAKSIGVGQYQHDVDQGLLKDKLDEVVQSCVNAVGVEVNTASKQLLSYVSGLTPSLAQNIILYRNEKGAFQSREDLKKVPRLGPKAFEQAAGFLRIRGSRNPLDASAVHPESYAIVQKMAERQGCTLEELVKDTSKQKSIKIQDYVTDTTGLPTLEDILKELAKPGRDPREQFEAFSFLDGVDNMDKLVVGMKMPGIVTNVTAFGAFVDIGVHQDGLVHISHLADDFVKNPADHVKVQQKVQVTVLEVDKERKRISLSMKTNPSAHRPYHPSASKPQSSSSSASHTSSSPRGGPRPQSHPRSFTSAIHTSSTSSSSSNTPALDWFSQALQKTNQKGR